LDPSDVIVQGTGILSTSGRRDALVFGGATRMVNLLWRTGGNYGTSTKTTMFSRWQDNNLFLQTIAGLWTFGYYKKWLWFW